MTKMLKNEKNLMTSSVDNSVKYGFDADGQRAFKYTLSSETLYFSKMWSLHTDAGNATEGGQSSKHIYLGETRIVTKLNSGKNPTFSEEYNRQYYYHTDHLGSAHLISDKDGNEYQRLEYTPYGEIWVEKTSNTGLQYLLYKFTGKEMDEETGLYYYGARYLDPKYSRWLSADPALGDYIPQAPINDEARRNNSNLPGMGGVFNHINGNLYHYAGNTPLRYIDPNGKCSYGNILFDDDGNETSFSNEDVKFMAQTIYGESRGENLSTKKAIAWVIRNRSERKGKSVEDIVTAKKQFDCWDPKNPNYDATINPEEHSSKNDIDKKAWEDCLSVAKEVLCATNEADTTNGATHYFDSSIDLPSWGDPAKEKNVKEVTVSGASKNVRFFKGIRF